MDVALGLRDLAEHALDQRQPVAGHGEVGIFVERPGEGPLRVLVAVVGVAPQALQVVFVGCGIGGLGIGGEYVHRFGGRHAQSLAGLPGQVIRRFEHLLGGQGIEAAGGELASVRRLHQPCGHAQTPTAGQDLAGHEIAHPQLPGGGIELRGAAQAQERAQAAGAEHLNVG